MHKAMGLSEPKMVYDLNTVLPPDGEDRAIFVYSDGELSVTLSYENESLAGQHADITIKFVNAGYFVKTPFPGVSLFSCPDDRKISLLNSLVEYQKSELLDAIRSNPTYVGTKHYRVFLHSVGLALHVVASNFEVYSNRD